MAEVNLENLPLDERVRRLERGHRTHDGRITRLEKTQSAVNKFLEVVPVLMSLEKHAKQLARLADAVDSLLLMVDGANRNEIFWSELWRRIGLVGKPGKLFWSLVLVIAGGVAGGYAYWLFAPPGGH